MIALDTNVIVRFIAQDDEEHAFEQQREDFADYLIREIAIAEGCNRLATFDEALLTSAQVFSP